MVNKKKKIIVVVSVGALVVGSIGGICVFSNKDKSKVEHETTTAKTMLTATLVSTEAIKVGYGKPIKASDIKLAIVSDTDTAVKFADGTEEKAYNQLGEVSDKLVVTDKENSKVEVEIKVAVSDTEMPIISGVSDKAVTQGDQINLLDGVSATDNVDGNVQVTVSQIDTNQVGAQQVTYTATDSSGNTASVTVNVTVNEKPIQELNETMYAISTVNIRQEATADSARLGGLSYAEAVTVTGKTDSNWYRINSDGMMGYVHGDYLQSTQPVQQSTSTPSQQSQSSSSSSQTSSEDSNQSSSQQQQTDTSSSDDEYEFNWDDFKESDQFTDDSAGDMWHRPPTFD